MAKTEEPSKDFRKNAILRLLKTLSPEKIASLFGAPLEEVQSLAASSR